MKVSKKISLILCVLFIMLGLNVQSVNAEELDEGKNISMQENADGADEVFDAFVEATSKVFDDPEWATYFKSTGYGGNTLLYEQYVRDGKKEDYESMSDFDKYVYSASYLRFASFVTEPYKMSEEEYMEPGEEGFERYCEDHFYYVSDDMNQEVRAAITDMLRWQFAYYREHNYPYNFVNKRSYLEETGNGAQEVYSEESVKEEVLSELTKEEKKELEEAFGDLEKEEELEKEPKKEIGAPINILVVIVVIVVLAVLCLSLRKKNKVEKD